MSKGTTSTLKPSVKPQSRFGIADEVPQRATMTHPLGIPGNGPLSNEIPASSTKSRSFLA